MTAEIGICCSQLASLMIHSLPYVIKSDPHTGFLVALQFMEHEQYDKPLGNSTHLPPKLHLVSSHCSVIGMPPEPSRSPPLPVPDPDISIIAQKEDILMNNFDKSFVL